MSDSQRFRPQDVRALLDLLANTDVEELVVERGPISVRVLRDPARARGAQRLVLSSADHVAPTSPNGEVVVGNLPENLVSITSGLVGLFFRGREPGQAALVEEGASVKAGQLLAVIESLRVPHPVEAPGDGVLERVLVEDGHAVEYGQAVMLLRPQS